MRILPLRTALAILVIVPAFAACHGAGRADASRSPAPPAEFVLAAGDSTFWVTSDPTGIHLRGAPLDLARIDGRFFEIYVVDDDHSFQGADLIGQRVYRRDLQTGDSTVLFTDSIVPQLALEYERAHPDDHRLGVHEQPDEQPLLRATATLDLDAAHGRFFSYSLHTDIERGRATPWHSSRRGVIDVERGGGATVENVSGGDAAGIVRTRDASIRSIFDSLRAGHDERSSRALAEFGRYHVDPGSFAITTVGGSPAIAYALLGSGDRGAGHLYDLAPIQFPEPVWWRDAAPGLPIASADGNRDVWRHGSYMVVVRYDSSGAAKLALRDSTSREWAVGEVSSPARRIYWLDRPRMDGPARHALTRAFDEAATYGSDTRVAVRKPAGPWHLARNRQ